MPNIKSAKKRVKVNAGKTLQNQIEKTELRTVLKKFDVAVATDKATASEIYKVAVKKLDKAANSGIMHKNNAARKKSAITIKLNAIAE